MGLCLGMGFLGAVLTAAALWLCLLDAASVLGDEGLRFMGICFNVQNPIHTWCTWFFLVAPFANIMNRKLVCTARKLSKAKLSIFCTDHHQRNIVV